jgi:hypothetical protein
VIDLRKVVDHDVRVVGIVDGVILMISLGLVESLKRSELSHNFMWEEFGLIELVDVGTCNSPLVFIGIENG